MSPARWLKSTNVFIPALCRFPREASGPQARNATTSGRRFNTEGVTHNEDEIAVLLPIALMFCAIPMFAQGRRGGAAGGGNIWVPVTAGFSMAIASGLCALGQGKAVAGAAEGMARNPGAFAGHPVRADSRSGADRIARALHLRHHLRESRLTWWGSQSCSGLDQASAAAPTKSGSRVAKILSSVLESMTPEFAAGPTRNRGCMS